MAFRCVLCDYEAPKYFDRCPECQRWEIAIAVPKSPENHRGVRLSAVKAPRVDRIRIRADWDGVLGGGVRPGSIVLVTGAPGAGKTTDMLDLACRAGSTRCSSLYFASELPLGELAARVIRLTKAPEYASRVVAYEARDVETVISEIYRRSPAAMLAVIDSWSSLEGAEPSHLVELRKIACGMPVFVVCHVTKEIEIAGAEKLVHLADALISVEPSRLVCGKNWHGPAGVEVERLSPLG